LRSILLQEPIVATSHTLAQRFLEMVRQRNEATLDSWLKDCLTSGIQEMANFASGLQQDEAAVRAALSLPWSTEYVAYCTSSPAWISCSGMTRSAPTARALV
jgi:transposase